MPLTAQPAPSRSRAAPHQRPLGRAFPLLRARRASLRAPRPASPPWALSLTVPMHAARRDSVQERLDRARLGARCRRARFRGPAGAGRARRARGRWPRSAAASPPGSGCCRCARPSPAPSLVAAEAAAAGAVGAEPGQLARSKAVTSKNRALVRSSTTVSSRPNSSSTDASSRTSGVRVDREPGPMDHRQRHTSKSPSASQAKTASPCVGGSRSGLAQVLLHPVEVALRRLLRRRRSRPSRGSDLGTASRIRFLSLMRYFRALRSRGSSFR